MADKERKKLQRRRRGAPVADNQNLLTPGRAGPILTQDWQLFEKHAHFNRERIPSAFVHAKGSAAYGMRRLPMTLRQFRRPK